MNIYQSWGFTENPFEVKAIVGNEVGKNLLVGRDSEKEYLLNRIYNPPKCITIEGRSGIGKTSLINVVSFEIQKRAEEDRHSPFFIPCIELFQLSEENNIDEFVDYVYYFLAQTILSNSKLIHESGIKLKRHKEVENFLNTYALQSLNFGAATITAGESIELNQTEAFKKSGFRIIVSDWLKNIKSSKRGGGIICILDNLELLRTSELSKKRLEYLRDVFLTKIGLRWILVGATGTFNGAVSSPRLNGILFDPIQIEGLNAKKAHDLISSRIEIFKSEEKPYLPIEVHGVQHLMKILKGNIRHVLHNIDEYCIWCFENKLHPIVAKDKLKILNEWLAKSASRIEDVMKEKVEPRGRDFFRKACVLGRSFSYTEYSHFGFEGTDEMKKYVYQLEAVEMLFIDKREEIERIELDVTPKGMIFFELKSG